MVVSVWEEKQTGLWLASVCYHAWRKLVPTHNHNAMFLRIIKTKAVYWQFAWHCTVHIYDDDYHHHVDYEYDDIKM